MPATTVRPVAERIVAKLLPLVVSIDTLRPHPKNPNVGRTDLMVESLNENKQFKPIIYGRGGIILGGNHTYFAAMELGWPDIAAVYVDVDWQSEEGKRITLADNEIGRRSTTEDGLLAELLQSMDRPTVGTGYDDELLAQLLKRIEQPLKLGASGSADEIPEPPAKPVSRLGDLWRLGPHRLLCGDAVIGADVTRLLAGNSAHLVVTSPPYAEQRKKQYGGVPTDAYGEWFARIAANVWMALAEDGSFMLNIKEHCENGVRHLYVKRLLIQLVESGWRWVDEFCWVDTKNGVPGRWPNRYKDAWEPVFHLAKQTHIKFHPKANSHPSDKVFDYSPLNTKTGTGSGFTGGEKAEGYHSGDALPSNVLPIAASGESFHSAAYPTELPRWFIRAFTDNADTVLDPFMGSGTTMIAAHQEGRLALGMEIVPTNCDIICRRFQQFTGEHPVLDETGEAHDFESQT